MVGGCMKLRSCKGRVFLRSYFDDDFQRWYERRPRQREEEYCPPLSSILAFRAVVQVVSVGPYLRQQ